MKSQEIYVIDNRGVTDGPFKSAYGAFQATHENYKDQHYTFHGKVRIVRSLMELDDFVYNGWFNEPAKLSQAEADMQSSGAMRRQLACLTSETQDLLMITCKQMADGNGIYELDLSDHSVRSTTDDQVTITGLTFDASTSLEPTILTEGVDTGIYGTLSIGTADISDLLFVLEYMEADKKNGNYPSGRLVLGNEFTEHFVKETVKAHYGNNLPEKWESIATSIFMVLISDHRGMPLDAELVKANI